MTQNSPALRTVQVTRYISPLREGGSLPALVEADDDFKYVLKFRGSGHGPKALIAELLGGEIARCLGLKVPELVFTHLDEAFGQSEADEEIQDLLQGSQGLNLALHFLPGSITFDPAVTEISARLASQIVWFDAFITNVDRTFKNTNMLVWHRELWLIDHGASFYFHHSGTDWEKHAQSPFAPVKDHVLLPAASLLAETNAAFRQVLSPDILRGVVALIPDSWLKWADTDETPETLREIYAQFLLSRLHHSDIFTQKAEHERAALI
ncbi:MAG: aminotransferase class I and II [Bacteroidetes bacterium]|nr:MAG: aminotransferase class I and II [Bacteroidota bacterium]